LVTGGVDSQPSNPTGKVKLWDTGNGSLLWSSPAHGTATRAVSVSKFDVSYFNPSGPPDWFKRTWMASGGDDGLIRIWNINDDSPYGCFVTLSGHTGVVNSVAFSTAQSKFASLASGGADGTVRGWDFDDAIPQKWMALTPGGAVNSVTDPVGSVNSLGDDGWTRVWNASTGTGEGAWQTHADHGYANQRHGGFVVSGGDDEVVVSSTEGWPERCYYSRARPVLAVSPGDGSWAVVPRSDVRLSLVNILAGREATSWFAHERPITCVAFSTVGDRFASGGEDQTVRVWDTTNSQAVCSLPATFTPQALAFTGLGETLVAGGSNQVVGWNVATTNARWTNTVASLVTDLAGSQFTSTMAIALTNGQIELRSSRSGALLHTLTHHTGCVNDLLITATGSQLISGSADGTIRFWDLTTGNPLGVLNNPGGATTALALSADDTILAAASEDGFLRFWRLADGVLLRTFGVEPVGIADMVFAAHPYCFLFTKADGELVVAYNSFVPLSPADLRLIALPVATNILFQFRLWTAEGVAYRIQTSSNLSAWSDWLSFLGSQGWTTFTDPASTNTAHRFFRAVAP
jgi:WD40 repeat protein